MTTKRQGIYLSPDDDAVLLHDLARAKAGAWGRKSDLLRNYAVQGLQRAMALCRSAKTDEQAALLQSLAELFAPKEAPPDFRSAADFVKAYNALQERDPQGPVAPAVNASAAVPRAPAPAPAPQTTEPVEPVLSKVEPAPLDEPKPRKQWSNLKSLVGGQSKSQDPGAE